MGALACGLEKGTLPGEATSTPLRKTWGMEHPEQSRPAAGSARLSLGAQAFRKTMKESRWADEGDKIPETKRGEKNFAGVGVGRGVGSIF